MRFSVGLMVTDQTMGIVEFARAAEDRGFDGIWLPDHTHIPVKRSVPFPEMGNYGTNGAVPEPFKRIIDPLVGLGMAAAVTKTIRLGTAILLAVQRDPIATAKAIATIDQQSGGRVTLGVGYGTMKWAKEELENHGVDPATRRQRTREHVLAMRELWENDEGAFDGEFVRFPPSWSWPKPIQKPLPVYMGGFPSDTLFSHVVEFAQGWFPMFREGMEGAIPRLRHLFEQAGRDPEELLLTPTIYVDEFDHARVDELQAHGVTEVHFNLPTADADTLLPILDRLAALIAERRRG